MPISSHKKKNVITMMGSEIMKDITITSSKFENNGWIPDCCSGYAEDKSPDICVNEIPEGTKSLAVIMDDLDHPVFKEFNHWVTWNIPCLEVIPGELPRGGVIDVPIHAEQGVGYGKHVYRGPKPPFNGKHRYRITVFALDNYVKLAPNSRKKALLKAIDGHVLAKGELLGIYQRKH